MTYTLPEAIIATLTKANQGLTPADLAHMIEMNKYWVGENGQAPTRQQVNTLVASKNYFARRDGRIFHQPGWVGRRLLRLTWNDQGWYQPIYHRWSYSNQGKRNVAHERKYGYGHEEWLRQEVFLQDGYQYGHIRGAQDLRNYYLGIKEAILFTIDPATKERYIVGVINNLELVSDFGAEFQIAEYLFKRNRKAIVKRLKEIKADAESLGQHSPFCVRFRPEDALFYENMLPAAVLRSKKFLRFQPYEITHSIEKWLEEIQPPDFFQFTEGKASNKKSYLKQMTTEAKTVSRIHTDITEALYAFLPNDRQFLQGKYSIERCFFGTHIADVVIQHTDLSYTIMEVKTGSNARRNIREALGQLMDYAAWYPEFRINQLVIVSPAPLTSREYQFFQRMRSMILTGLSYWQYIPDCEAQRFKKYA